MLQALDGSRSRDELEGRFGARAVGDVIAQMQDLDLLEDAERRRARPGARTGTASTASCATSAIVGCCGGVTPSECQAAAARGPRRGARRGRARRARGVGACLLRRRRAPARSTATVSRRATSTGRSSTRRRTSAGSRSRRRRSGCGPSTRRSRSRLAPRRIESQAQLADAIAGADIVIDAADWPAHEIEYWCNAACFEAGIPVHRDEPASRRSHGPGRCTFRGRPAASPARTSATGASTRSMTWRSSSAGGSRRRPPPSVPPVGWSAAWSERKSMHFLTGLIAPAMLGRRLHSTTSGRIGGRALRGRAGARVPRLLAPSAQRGAMTAPWQAGDSARRPTTPSRQPTMTSIARIGTSAGPVAS